MATIGLTEVLASLSLVTDLGSGFAPEKGLRACLVAVAVGRQAGLDDPDLADAFQATLLGALGCTAFATENAGHFDDDLAFQRDMHFLDVTDPHRSEASARGRENGEAPNCASTSSRSPPTSGRSRPDIGRTSVSTATWERPGPLSAGESDQVRLHAYWSERVLERSPALSDLALCAGSHHERLDGSGYHRGTGSASLPRESRLLAAADVMHALREARPHRPAFDLATAARMLGEEAKAGRLDPEATAAVVEAAGAPRPRKAWPADLTDREVDVLRLAGQGLSNKQIADELVVSPRTVQHHLAHVYDKTGRRTRAGNALFAMEHGLLDAG
jgi:DNA-binding CsgD family transcriptional regulator